jgi:hypothetical protein
MSAVATARVERPTYTYINLQPAKGSLRQRKRSNAILISGRNSVLVYFEPVRIRAWSKCGQSDFADISLAEELTECLLEDSSLIGDKAYDSSTLRQGAGAKGIKTCIKRAFLLAATRHGNFFEFGNYFAWLSRRYFAPLLPTGLVFFIPGLRS